jgi:methionyl-tRNA formyltransferase
VKILIITQEEPFYIPYFIEKVVMSIDNVAALVTTSLPPKSSSLFAQIKELYRLFGPRDFTIFGVLFIHHKLLDHFRRYVKTKRSYSVKSVALKKSVPYYRLKNINEPDSLHFLSSFTPDVIVSIACPQIFRKPLIKLSRYCINIHAALLPKNRGRMPSFWALAKGESITGVTVHYIDEGIDTGNIIIQKPIEISRRETWHSLQNKVAEIGSEALLEALHKIENGDGTGTSQRRGGNYNSQPSKEALREFRSRGRRFI